MLFCKNDICIYFGTLNPIPHSHHALEISIGTQSTLLLHGSNSILVEFEACIILPNLLHKIIINKDVKNHEKITILIDADLPIARGLVNYYKLKEKKYFFLKQNEINIYIKSLLNAKKFLESDNGDSVYTAFLQFIDFLLPKEFLQRIKPLDERIQMITEYIQQHIQEQQFSFKEVAKIVCLSESRLAHLFKSEIGIPFRKYVLWKRIKKAAWEVQSGSNITNAAYVAGFSDAAHFSKVYSEMLGLKPSLPLKDFSV